MPKGKTIIDAQILDPSILPDAPKGKVSIMDIKVRLNDGKLINIELQTFNQKRFKSRALYYWAKLYSDQLKEKDEYFKLKKTISLIFADFILLNRGDRLLIKGEGARKGGSKKEQRIGQEIRQEIRQGIEQSKGQENKQEKGQGIGQKIEQGIKQRIKQGQIKATGKTDKGGDFFNSFSIRSDKAPHVIFVGDLQILTVELARFLKKDIDLLVDLRESWCYLIKESHNLSLFKS